MSADNSTRLITRHFGNEERKRISVYESLGGYTALRKALSVNRDLIISEVKASNLRGRGGAGFPTGIKWGFVPKDAKDVHLVCNCDESEPGTCKDREIVYWDPHLLIEGMIISAFALGATHNYIYIRGEMMREVEVLRKAVQEAYDRGYLGKNVMGTAFRCEITVHRGAGAYICGEETALLNSLEGLRGRASTQAAISRRRGSFRQTDSGQQRRDLVQRAAHRRKRRPVVRSAGRWPLRRDPGSVCLRTCREARRVRAADDGHLQRTDQRHLRRRVEGPQGQRLDSRWNLHAAADGGRAGCADRV